MKRTSLTLSILLLFAGGCSQEKGVETQKIVKTIFEQHPDWNYLICSSYDSGNPNVHSGVILAIEPNKILPETCGWHYLYNLDYTWGGTSDIEDRMISGDWYGFETDNPDLNPPDFLMSSFFCKKSTYCGTDESEASSCEKYSVLANPRGHADEEARKLYLNRSTLWLDGTTPSHGKYRCEKVNPERITSEVQPIFEQAKEYYQHLIKLRQEYQKKKEESYKL